MAVTCHRCGTKLFLIHEMPKYVVKFVKRFESSSRRGFADQAMVHYFLCEACIVEVADVLKDPDLIEWLLTK